VYGVTEEWYRQGKPEVLAGKPIWNPLRAPNLTLSAADGGSGSTRNCTDTSDDDDDNRQNVTRKVRLENEYFRLQT
jgi:hypothetical protein